MDKEDIISIIQRYFGNTDRSKQSTLSALEDIGSVVDGYIDVLREELENEEE